MYMVGDVKQSIYKFRLACPELFMKKYYSYQTYKNDNAEDIKEALTDKQKACRIELQKNFRSRKNILDTTNDVFYRVMNRNYCGIEYDSSQQLNCGLDYPECKDKRNFGWESEKSTDVVLIDTSEDDENSSIEAEALYAVKRIKALMTDENPYYVYDTDLSDYRRIQYGDIAILTRTLTGWADTFVNVLLDNDIPAMAETAQQYFKVREIKVLISLLTCIDNPMQDIPMASVLLSYFGGFTEDELAMLRVYGKNASKTDKLFIKQIKAVKGSGNAALKELSYKCGSFLDKLAALRKKSRLMTIYDLLWDIVYNTGYYDYVGTMPAGKKRQSNIDVLLDRASSFEGTSYSGLFNFLRYIERLQKYDIELTDSQGSGVGSDAVRVMSIHKSKGLEFPVVIMAGLNKQINKMDARNRLVIDQELGIGTDYVNLDKHTKTSTIIKGAVARKILRDSISEEERVLYVAMTRAREKLIMIGSVTGTDKKMSAWQMLSVELALNGIYSYAECENIDKYSDMVMPVALMDKTLNSGIFNVCIITSDEDVVCDTAADNDQASDTDNVQPCVTDNTRLDESVPYIKEKVSDMHISELPEYIKDPECR